MTKSTLILEVKSPELDADQVSAITQDLLNDLSKEGFKADQIYSDSNIASRGDAITIGQIGLAMITSGGVSALIECFKALINRDKSLTIDVKRPDGSSVHVDSKNVDSEETSNILQEATQGK